MRDLICKLSEVYFESDCHGYVDFFVPFSCHILSACSSICCSNVINQKSIRFTSQACTYV